MVFVSCFFPVTTGKLRHPISVYHQRAQWFFNSYLSTTPLYIFTTHDGLTLLKNATVTSKNNQSNPNYKNIHFITKYQDVFDIPKIAQHKQQYEEIAVQMIKTECYVVNAQFGAIWNAKIIFFQEVIEQYEPNADFVFWVDIGVIKSDEFFKKKEPFMWPNRKRILRIFSTENNTTSGLLQRMLFFAENKCTRNPRNLDEMNIRNFGSFITACFFGGPVEAAKFFIANYWKIHDTVIVKKQYVLREEMIMGAYSVLNKDKVFFINMKGSKCNMWHSVIGFISTYNLCQYSNEVLYYNNTTACTYPVPLNHWI